jgi:hypothetical protein
MAKNQLGRIALGEILGEVNIDAVRWWRLHVDSDRLYRGSMQGRQPSMSCSSKTATKPTNQWVDSLNVTKGYGISTQTTPIDSAI